MPVNRPATELGTIYEILCRACAVRDKLVLTSIVCVFDEAMYAKASDIKWKEKEKFKHIILFMGGFHTLMMALGVVGKRFADAGLKDTLIQSGVVAEGSIESVMTGKM